jgi:hypothetical protein
VLLTKGHMLSAVVRDYPADRERCAARRRFPSDKFAAPAHGGVLDPLEH